MTWRDTELFADINYCHRERNPEESRGNVTEETFTIKLIVIAMSAEETGRSSSIMSLFDMKLTNLFRDCAGVHK